MIYKFLSVLEYLGVLVLLLSAFLGGYIFYPIMYLFRNSIRNTPVFWWWFDDEDGYYGAEYWRRAKEITKYNFWVSYRWSGMRNPMWNAHTKLKPISGNELIQNSWGHLTRNGENIDLINTAVINFVDDNGVYQGNAGDNFSEELSVIGWSFIFFKKKNDAKARTYLRFSLSMKLYKRRWIILHFGAFHRFIWKFKFSMKK